MKEQEKQADKIAEGLAEKEEGFLFIFYQAQAWGDDYSPWEASNPLDKAVFGGRAKNTLCFMENALYGLLNEEYGQYMRSGKPFLVGYSLAGLFCLWSFWNSALFDGVACCSGSLWYDHFVEYIRENEPKGSGAVYISLGDKEGKTKNPVLSQVNECTGNIVDVINQTASVERSTFTWNVGGHFQNVEQRISDGCLWLLDK